VSDIYGLAALVLGFAWLGFYAVMQVTAWRKRPNAGGTWRRTQETVANGGSFRNATVRVVLVREYKGRETGRLVIREIDSSDPLWDDKYWEAITEADRRLAALESSEQQ
jgi:hypothetical protein